MLERANERERERGGREGEEKINKMGGGGGGVEKEEEKGRKRERAKIERFSFLFS